MMKYTRITGAGCLLALSLTGLPQSAYSDSLDLLDQLAQSEFLQLSENTAAATHYKSIAPAEPLGVLGFDISVDVSSTDIDSQIFNKASVGGFSTDTFLVPRVHVHKGLPFNLDIGASLTSVSDTDFRIVGAELRYAILEGSVVTPAVAIRGSYSAISGVDEVDMSSAGVELSISKGIANFTPYGGVGIIFTESTPKVGTLQKESFDQSKVYAGININLGLINVGFEGDVTGDYTTYTAKFGFRF